MNIKAGTIKRIHVDQGRIKSNFKHGTNLPVATVQTSKGSHKAHRVRINGASELVTSFDKPLSCGARVWVETKAEVELVD